MTTGCIGGGLFMTEMLIDLRNQIILKHFQVFPIDIYITILLPLRRSLSKYILKVFNLFLQQIILSL